jgi:broad specificity phosphatase PhoE
VFLVRHGQSEFNVVFNRTRIDPGIEDPALTDEGRRQAVAAARSLRDHDLKRIVASPYTRALQTAEIVAGALGLPIDVDPLAGERCAFACDIGTPRSALARAWPTMRFDHLEESWWPGSEEPEAAFHLRCGAFRDLFKASSNWPGTVVITHWGVIRALTGRRVSNGEIVRFDPTVEHEIPHPDGL